MLFSSQSKKSISTETSAIVCNTMQQNKNSNQGHGVISPTIKSKPHSTTFHLFRGILTFSLIVIAHDALNASTGVNGTPEYLHWLLKNKSLSHTLTAPAPEPLTVITPVKAPFVINSPQPKSRIQVIIERIRRSDTYADLMERQNIPEKTIKQFAQAAKPIFDFSQKLKTDTPVKFTFNHQHELIGLGYPISREYTLRILVDDQQKISAFLENSLPLTPSEKILIAQKSLNIEGNQLENDFKATPDEENGLEEANQAEADTLIDEEDDDDIIASTPLGTPPPSAKARPKKINKFADSEDNEYNVTIRPGDSLASLLSRRKISSLTALKISKVARPVFDLARQLSPGKTVTLSIADNGDLKALVYPVDNERTLWITAKKGDKFSAKFKNNPLEVRMESIDGTVHNERSLFVAAKHGGLSKSQAIKLAGLFEWDIDFAHDLHPGDHFTIVQEGLFSKGKRVRDGDIVAAEFTNRGKLFRAVRYIDPKGRVNYYDKDGKNIRKMFIRAPMDFTRISSHFSNNRMHPVFGYNRAHKGVDYAAPQGTPVRASGDGVIDYIGYTGGFGKLITIRHSNKYTTAYAHLSSFTKGLRKGSRIQQGSVIGRVGATGTATGPHLHYEVRINNQQVNPLSIQLPSSGPVQKKFQADFNKQSKQLLALLKKRKTGDVTHLASLLLPQVRTHAR